MSYFNLNPHGSSHAPAPQPPRSPHLLRRHHDDLRRGNHPTVPVSRRRAVEGRWAAERRPHAQIQGGPPERDIQITFEGTNGGDPSGDILADAKYKAANATTMSCDRQLTARANYDATIKENDPARHSKEENWYAGIQNQARKRAIERGACD